MLAKQTLLYLFARGLPGVVNFSALAIYTRLLSQGDFGRYSLSIAATSLTHVLVFQALILVLGRFFPANATAPKVLLESILALFLSLAAGVLIVAVFTAMFITSSNNSMLAITTGVLSIAQAWHELNLRLSSAKLDPIRYGFLGGTKAALALILGVLFFYAGLGPLSPLFGLIAGSMLSWLAFGSSEWVGMRPKWPGRENLREYLAYGFPLALTFALVWITSSSDRLMLAWLLDEAATGVYSVGYDLAQNSLGVLLTIVNTAAMPIALRKLETEGAESAKAQMKENGQLIFFLACTGSAWLVAASSVIIGIFVGPAFRNGASLIFPWIAIVAAIVGIKSFHFDIAFHLSKKPKSLLITSGLAALANIFLNLILIPRYGILGAAWAGLLAYFLATASSALLGRKHFPMPPFTPLLVAGIVPGICVWAVATSVLSIATSPITQLGSSLLVAGIVVLSSAFLLDIAGCRRALVQKYKSKRK